MLVCDIREEQPLEPAVLPLGDRLTSSLCLEAVCAALGATAELCSILPALWCSLSGGSEISVLHCGRQEVPCTGPRGGILCEALQEKAS